MSLPVHWVETLAGCGPGAQVEVVGDEAHHAVTVRRLRVGEAVVVTDGRGARAAGTVAATGKGRLVVAVAEVETLPEPLPAVTVVQALPKGDRGELAVEVLTEVGVATIVPWAASRSVAAWRGERADKGLRRWRAAAREAAKQARRSWWPEVTEPATLDQVVGLVGSADVAVVLHESAVTPLSSVAMPFDAGSLVLVVGPEGGLTDDEVAALTAAGAHACKLGAEVLRTSTAGVAGVAALLARTRRWT